MADQSTGTLNVGGVRSGRRPANGTERIVLVLVLSRAATVLVLVIAFLDRAIVYASRMRGCSITSTTSLSTSTSRSKSARPNR